MSVAGRLINAVAQPIIARGGGVSVTPSIGIAVSTPGHDPRELVREALEALGHAKEAGPARAAVYDPSQRDNRLPPLSR